MAEITTDYLIVGAGAVGLAFADTLLSESPQARLMIVDRHGLPGGHWNDAYDFVALHQPSAFYGVASLPLGTQQVERGGLNDGFLDLASGAEVRAHFQRAMRERLLPGGRVDYRPLSTWETGPDGRHRCRSLLSTWHSSDLILYFCDPNAAGESPGDKYGYFDLETGPLPIGAGLYSVWANPLDTPTSEYDVRFFSRGKITSTTSFERSAAVALSLCSSRNSASSSLNCSAVR